MSTWRIVATPLSPVVQANTTQHWAVAFFTPAQLADPNISGPGADFDGDGLATFLDYALNLDPTIPHRDTLPEADRGIPRAAVVTAFDPVSQSEQPFPYRTLRPSRTSFGAS